MGYCINCDNRHGCKSGAPICLTEPYKKLNAGRAPGKDLMRRLGKLAECEKCCHFKACRKPDGYRTAKE